MTWQSITRTAGWEFEPIVTRGEEEAEKLLPGQLFFLTSTDKDERDPVGKLKSAAVH